MSKFRRQQKNKEKATKKAQQNKEAKDNKNKKEINDDAQTYKTFADCILESIDDSENNTQNNTRRSIIQRKKEPFVDLVHDTERIKSLRTNLDLKHFNDNVLPLFNTDKKHKLEEFDSDSIEMDGYENEYSDNFFDTDEDSEGYKEYVNDELSKIQYGYMNCNEESEELDFEKNAYKEIYEKE